MQEEIFLDEFSACIASRYVVCEKLGAGTFGEVRKAVDRYNGDNVAIKYIPVLSRDGSIPKAVFREMESLKRLSGSCHIVKSFEVFSEDTKLCLVTEYVKYNLADIIARRKSYFSRSQLKIFMKMILESICYCHSNSIIHRDIKPASNVVLSPS
jgi:serine/threonine protein kinase